MFRQIGDTYLTLTFIGTGAVYATPVLGCDCLGCQRAEHDSRYERLPASLLIKTSTTSTTNNAINELNDTTQHAPDSRDTVITSLLIDAGHPRLEQVVKQHNLKHILLTHYHPDHVQGLFALRWGMPHCAIQVIAPDDPVGCADLFKNSGILNFEQKTHSFIPFSLDDITITPLPMRHSKLTHGYLVEHSSITFAYLTDTLGLDDSVITFINQKHAKLCIIDCTYAPTESPHNHNNLLIVQDLQDKLGGIRMWLTHIGHGMDAWYWQNHEKCSAQDIHMARDNITLNF